MEVKNPIFSLLFILAIYLSTKNTFAASREIGNPTCLENQFQCETGGCISQTRSCDGRVDCADLSDETNCNHTDTVLNLEEYSCGGYTCGDGTCLPYSKNCDGIVDCDDDEEYCGWKNQEINCYSDTQYLCDDNTCLPKNKVCDGIPDCDSDETFCFEGKQCDPVKNFKCNNGECINHYGVCDGSNDCGDLSDEINCCDFTCASSGACLLKHMRCDGNIDCADLSDEKTCHSGHPNGNRRR